MTPTELAELERLRAAIPIDAGLYLSGEWHAYQKAVAAFNGALCRHGAALLETARRASVLEERNGKLEERVKMLEHERVSVTRRISLLRVGHDTSCPRYSPHYRGIRDCDCQAEDHNTDIAALRELLAPSTKGEG